MKIDWNKIFENKCKDEVEVTFLTALGAVLGRTLINKEDENLFKIIGKISKYIIVKIDGKLYDNHSEIIECKRGEK